MFGLFRRRARAHSGQLDSGKKRLSQRERRIQPHEQREQEEQRQYEEWLHQQRDLIDDLPWFGERVLPQSCTGKRGKGESLTRDDAERVMLSWLTGGSSRRIASRIGVGKRTVYNVLRRLVYRPDPDTLLSRWFEAGLYACMFSPRFPTIQDSGYQDVICLICHRNVGHYYWLMNPRGRVGETFRPEPSRHLRGLDKPLTARSIQCHLLLHFWLGDDPIPWGSFWRTRAWDSLPAKVAKEAEYLGPVRRYEALGCRCGIRRGMASLEDSRAWPHERSGSTATTGAKNAHLPQGQTKHGAVEAPLWGLIIGLRAVVALPLFQHP